MRKLQLSGLLLVVSGLSACGGQEIPCVDFGQGLTGAARVESVRSIVEDPAAFAGRSLAVEGRVTKVCAAAGCWLELGDSSIAQSAPTLRVTVADGGMVFPLSARGKLATVEGTLIADDPATPGASASGVRSAPEIDARGARVCG